MRSLFIFLFTLLAINGANSQGCLPQGIKFRTQAQIDNFQTNYPGCTEIEWDVSIYGSDISNLNGLDIVTSIGGFLTIGGIDQGNPGLTNLTGLDNLNSVRGLVIERNYALTSLTGLDNLTSISDDIYIYDNDSLTSLTALNNLTSIGGVLHMFRNWVLTNLTGLDNLTSIGGDLFIGDSFFGGNPALTSLTALNNLTSIGGDLYIYHNEVLTSLSGLDNIAANSINGLAISGNLSLSTCDVESICDYLASPNGNILIYGNAPGCNSQLEVEEACGIVNVEINAKTDFFIYPNPTTGLVTISQPENSPQSHLTILNLSGQEILHQAIIGPTTTINISHLPAGIYFVRLQNEKMVEVGKLIKN